MINAIHDATRDETNTEERDPYFEVHYHLSTTTASTGYYDDEHRDSPRRGT